MIKKIYNMDAYLCYDKKEIPAAMEHLGFPEKKLFSTDLETFLIGTDKPTTDVRLGEIGVVGLVEPDTLKAAYFRLSPNMSEKDMLAGLSPLLKESSFIAHNAFFEFKFFYYRYLFHFNEILQIEISHDTMILGQLVDNRKSRKLKDRIPAELDEIGWGIDLFHIESEEQLRDYNLLDCLKCLQLLEVLQNQLTPRNIVQHPDSEIQKEIEEYIYGRKLLDNMKRLYQLQLDNIPLLAKMEIYSPVKFDVPYAKRTFHKVERHLDLLIDLVNMLVPAGLFPFNINSSVKMKELLYHPMSLDIPIREEFCERSKFRKHPYWLRGKMEECFPPDPDKKGAKRQNPANYSKVLTGRKTLRKIKEYLEVTPGVPVEKIELISALVETKKLAQCKNTLSELSVKPGNKMPYRISTPQVSGRFTQVGAHPSLNLSHNPDVDTRENYPFLRSLVIPDKGWNIVCADFRNQEFRILLVFLLEYIKQLITDEKEAGKIEKLNEGKDKLIYLMKLIMAGIDPVSYFINFFYRLDYEGKGKNINDIKDDFKRFTNSVIFLSEFATL